MSERVLEVRNLNAWYGDSQVLRGVDIDVFRGETVTLLGRNGAGKSTTLKSICGALQSRQGTISLNGAELSRLPVHEVARRGLGYVPEDRGIFASLTVHENLLLPPLWDEGGFTLAEIYELFPNLKERLASPGTKLSGGEQQMLAIARVLRTGPKLLLLDEPTEGLAPVVVQRIGAIVRLLKERGIPVLLVEQNFRFASRIADRHYVMEDGAVVDMFHADELARKGDRIQELLGV